MSGKGSNRRKGDDAVKFRENYDKIFNLEGTQDLISKESKVAVDWRSDGWFAEFHADKISDDFKEWWIDYYGRPLITMVAQKDTG